MNTLEPLSVALGLKLSLALVHFLWQGAVIAFFALVAVRLADTGAPNRARIRYGIYMASLFVMLFAFAGTIWRIEPAKTTPANLSESEASIVINGSPVGTPVITPGVVRRTEAKNVRSFPNQSPQSAPKPLVVSRASFSDWFRTIEWEKFIPWTIALYFAGAWGMLGRLLLGLKGGLRLRRQSRAVEEGFLLEALRRQGRVIGLRLTPAMAICQKVLIPTVVGVLKPTILLPVSFASGLTSRQIEMLLAHELAHIRRYDPLFNVVQRFIEAILFFHPAVWFISRRARLEREKCCDDLVLATGGSPLAYATSLVEAAERGLLGSPARRAMANVDGLSAVGDEPSQLRARVLRLLGESEHEQVRLRQTWLLVLVFVFIPLVGSLTLSNRATASKSEKEDQNISQSAVDRRLFGQVVDHRNAPVPGIKVTAIPIEPHPMREAMRVSTRTDKAGRFEMTAPVSGLEYMFDVPGSQHSFARAMPGDGKEIQITLAASRKSHNLEGVVRDASGKPASGARVVLVGEYHFNAEVRTDAGGNFRIAIPESGLGQGVIRAEKEESISPHQIVRYQDRSVDLRLGRPAAMTGMVKDLLSGLPIEGCEITLTPTFASDFDRKTTTDSAGKFKLDRMSPGEYCVYASAPAYSESPERGNYQDRVSLPLKPGQTGFHRVDLRPMTLVMGRALRHDGQPAANAMIAFIGGHNSAQTDKEGRFTILADYVGETLGVFSKTDGFAQVDLKNAAKDQPLQIGDIFLAYTFAIRGTVRGPNKEPVEGARVLYSSGYAIQPETLTDADGRFDLGRRTAGPKGTDRVSLKIIASRRPGKPLFRHKEVHLDTAPEKEFDLDIVLSPTEQVKFNGRVLDANGKPVAGARVFCFPGYARKSWHHMYMPNSFSSGMMMTNDLDILLGQTTSNENGEWVLQLAKENTEDLRIAHHVEGVEYSSYSIGVIGSNRETKLVRDIVPGENATRKSIDIVMSERKSSSITGRAVDPEARPLSGITLRLGERPMGGLDIVPLDDSPPVVTGKDGAFALTVDDDMSEVFILVQADGWAIRLPKPERGGNAFSISRAKGGFTDQKIVLEKTAVVTGSVRWSSGEPANDYTVHHSVEKTGFLGPEQKIIDANGKFRIDNFPPGEATVWVSATSGVSVERHVALAPGGSAQIEVVLPVADCLIRGRVVDDEGRPASGVKAQAYAHDKSSLHVHLEAFLDADGNFEFQGPPGDYTVTLEPIKSGRSRAEMPEAKVVVERGKPTEKIELIVRRNTKTWNDLVVEIVNKRGEPIEGVTVESGGGEQQGGASSGQTDAEGKFLIKGLETGNRYVILTDPKRMLNEQMRLSVRVGEKSPTTHRVVLDEGYRLRGRVTHKGQPVENIQVLASVKTQNRSSSFRTGKDGVFQFINLPKGKFTLLCRAYGSIAKTYDIKGDINDVEIQLPTGRIVGKILDAQGRPLKRRYISLEQIEVYGDYGKAEPLNNNSGEDGLIDISRLGDGLYRLRLTEVYGGGGILAVSKPIEIRNGQTIRNVIIRERADD